MFRWGYILVVTAAASIAVPRVAAAQYGGGTPPPAEGAEVEARGNPASGGLGFYPDTVTVRVGGVVRWTNTDVIAAHTATEDHGLWDLGGTYGQTPFNPPGFGPGMSVKRQFEAGTATYYCRVHPATMHGTVRVPVHLSLAARRVTTKRRVRSRRIGRVRTVRRVRTRYHIDVTWAPAAPPSGQVFDIEIKRDGGAWRPLRTGTTQTGARISAGAKRGAVTTARARLRRANDARAATGWSPEAKVARP